MLIRKTSAAALGLLAATLLVTGCGSDDTTITGPTQAPTVTRSFAFATPLTSALNKVLRFNIDTGNGRPTQLTDFALPGALAAGSLTSDVSGRFLYVTRNTTTFSSLVVNEVTGGLTHLADIAGTFPNEGFELVTNAQGSLVANPANTAVRSYRVGQNGTLAEVLPAAALPGGATAFDGVFEGSGQFGYFIDPTNIYRCSVNQATGALTFVSTTNLAGANLTDIVVDDTNRFIYVLNDAGNSIHPFRLNADGTLTALAVANLAAGTYSDLTNRNPVLATVDEANGTTRLLLMQQDGTLAAVAATGTNGGRGLSITPFLPYLVGGSHGGSATNFGSIRVLQDGSQIQAPGSPLAVPAADSIRDISTSTFVTNQ